MQMPLTEIFRAGTARACEHRAFVLRAVGIPSDVVMMDNAFVLFVASDLESSAREQLARYEHENAPAPPPPVSRKLHAPAYIAPTLYALVLILCAYLAGVDAFAFDWYATGALTSSISQTHEWWRAATALTLHVDHDHLLRNIGFGALLSYFAARLLGSGVALGGMIAAGIMGNVLDSILMPATHTSIGASTIVFATLGLISAFSWRMQFSKRLRWAHRWAPLIVGVMLLGLMGSGGEHTDVLGHLTGFFCGVVIGAALALIPTAIFDKRVVQFASAASALAVIALAWLSAAVIG
jgi:rhomboid protease GluP